MLKIAKLTFRIMRPIIRLNVDAERRLRNIMEIRGLETMEDAAEFAFLESERKALMEKLYANPLPDEAWGDAFYPDYDLDKLRAMDMPYPPSNDQAAA